MITVDQYHEFRNDHFSGKLYRISPKHCKYCSFPIIINVNKTHLRCSNPICPKHMSFKAELMFKDMGIKGIGSQTALKIIVQNNLTSHMDILGLNASQMPSGNSADVRMKMFHSLQEGRQQSMGKILRYYQIDDIADQSSLKIMKGFNSFQEFFDINDTLEKLIQHFCRSLNQSRTMPLIRMAYHMFCSKEDLTRCQRYFNVIQSSKEQVNVAITGEVLSVYSDTEVWKPREKIIDYLNKKYENIVTFALTGSNVSKAKFLLTDGTTGKSKLAEASQMGIPILSFNDFVTWVEEKYGFGNESYILYKR